MSVDYENDLLLVTAASGRQVSALLPHLVKKWKRLRLNVASQGSKERLQQQFPDAEVTQVDISDAHACKALLEGVTACFLVTPPFHPHETECGYNIIDAALANKKSGGPFKHMLHSSVIFPVLRKLLNHDSKRYIVEYLIESGLSYTIIEPTHLMETTNLAPIVNEEKPIMARFWKPSTLFSFLSCRDLGEAAANILDEREKHFYATYQLVGTQQPLSYNDVAKIVSEELGREVRLEQKSIEEGVQMFSAMMTKGKPDLISWETRQSIGRMFMYYNDKGLLGNPSVLQMLLGRKPLDYRDWVKLTLSELRG